MTSQDLTKRGYSKAGAIVCVLGLVCAGLAIKNLFFSGDGDPYAYQRVAGTVLYDDGQVIPSDTLTLTFIPLVPPRSPSIHPRPGVAFADPKTGAFQSATSRKPGDGLVQGGHKVLITGARRLPLPKDIVPLEYADFTTTPLEVDTKSGQFNLRVKRPPPESKEKKQR